MRVTGLFVYPIKGMRGIALDEAELDAFGLRHDRRWMLVDEAGVAITQRQQPRLVLVRGELATDTLRLTAPGRAPLELALEPPVGERRDVVIWGDRVDAVRIDPAASAWFGELLAIDCEIVYLPPTAARSLKGDPRPDAPRVAFSDGFPLHLVATASLADLNRRLDQPVSVDRFRPNVLIETRTPYAEDAWHHLRIGEVEVHVVKPCVRCTVTTVDLDQGRKGKEPLRTLSTYRMGEDGVEFGIYAAHASRGRVRVGDDVVHV